MATKQRKFKLEIELENETMRTRRHVISALVKLSQRLRNADTEGAIVDDNGNVVGRWAFAWELAKQ